MSAENCQAKIPGLGVFYWDTRNCPVPGGSPRSLVEQGQGQLPSPAFPKSLFLLSLFFKDQTSSCSINNIFSQGFADLGVEPPEKL